jgi:tRNA A-37 threonylcarbamoyl transferase component Bud32/tetratricopeptide (TPR) repeat protein
MAKQGSGTPSEEGTVADPAGREETPTIGLAPQGRGGSADPTELTTAPSLPGVGQNEPAAGSRTEAVTVGSQPPAGQQAAGPEPVLRSFGDYELLQELARGGMGVVYKARQRKLNRVVALKMILAGRLASAADVQRFYTEAEAAAQLDHAGIVRIYEVGEQDGQHFFSMSYVAGGSLAAAVKDGPLPPREAAALVRKVAEAVAYAHDRGIIHRDLKPANILLDEGGQPQVTDFGLAKRLAVDSQLTGTGQVMGTPGYMPPEQAEGSQQVGPASDVYALGAILYCLLTGRPPFQAASVMDTLRQVLEQEPAAPRLLNPVVDRDLETICLKCLEKQAGKRYASARALADDLDRYLAGEPILARPVGGAERLGRWCRRNPRTAATVAAVSLLLLLVSIGSTWAALTIRQERNQKEAERQAAEAAREEADAARKLAQQNEVMAAEQADLALQTVNTLIFEVQHRLSKDPGLQPLKRELLRTALEGLQRVADRAGGDSPRIRWSTEDALMRMGELALQFNNSEEAYGYFQRRYEMTRADLQTEPGNARLLERVAMACVNLAEVSTTVRRDMKKALSLYQEAVTLRTQVADIPADELRRQNDRLLPSQRMRPFYIKLNLSEGWTRVGLTHYFLGEPAQAEGPILKSLALREELVTVLLTGEAAWSLSAIPTAPAAPLSVAASVPLLGELASEQRQNLARNYHLIGEIYFRLRNLEQSLLYYARCVAIREAALAANPKDYRLRGDLGQFYEYYGTVHLFLGDTRQALPLYDRSLQLLREVNSADKSVEFRKNLAAALYSRGTAAQRMNDAAGAERCFRECLQIRKELAASDPRNDRARMDLMLVLPHCGEHKQAAELAEALRTGRQNDRELLVTIARCYAQCAAAVSGDTPLAAQFEQKALGALQAAVAQGYSDRMMLESAPDLDPVRGSPEFKILLEKVKTSAAAPQ